MKELVCAGGMLAMSGCSTSPGPPCGNANPDPCICGRPDHNPPLKAECAARDTCEMSGGSWSDPYLHAASIDGGTPPYCVTKDGGVPDAH